MAVRTKDRKRHKECNEWENNGQLSIKQVKSVDLVIQRHDDGFKGNR